MHAISSIYLPWICRFAKFNPILVQKSKKTRSIYLFDLNLRGSAVMLLLDLVSSMILKVTPNSSASNKPQDHPSCNTQEPWSPWARPPIHHLWSTDIGLSGYCRVIHESFMSLLGHLEKKSRVQTFVFFFTPMKVIQAMGFPGTRVVKPRCLYDWCSSSAGFHWHAHC